MPTPGLVSVIIPVFNGEKYLAPAIESILGQTYEPIELFVVDDASTDRSAEVAEGYADRGVKTIRLGENSGQSVARNRGLALAEGEFLTTLDADDMMKPTRVERQVQKVREGHDFVLVLEEFLIEEDVEPPPLVTARRAPISRDLKEIYQTNSWLMNRDGMERIGPMDESLRFGEDVDFCLRAFDSGCRVGTIPEALTIRRFHGANMTYDHAEVQMSAFQALKRRIERHRSGATLRAESATGAQPPTEG